MDFIRLLRIALVLLAGALLALHISPANAGGITDSTFMLVAKPEVSDPFYTHTVLIVGPLDGGGHAGLVLNKPTDLSLGQVFPGDGPSQKVREPVFVGGQERSSVIVALVKSDGAPGKGTVEFAKGLHIAFSAEALRRAIRDPDHARFFAGVAVWHPGELEDELKLGAWYVIDVDSELALTSEPFKLWNKLVQRARGL